jgi:hypothetical protein
LTVWAVAACLCGTGRTSRQHRCACGIKPLTAIETKTKRIAGHYLLKQLLDFWRRQVQTHAEA